jgi:hypothetical protein
MASKTCMVAHTQVSEQEPANGSILSSATLLLRLVHLHVCSSPRVVATSLLPGFGGLCALTCLIFCKVSQFLSTFVPDAHPSYVYVS